MLRTLWEYFYLRSYIVKTVVVVYAVVTTIFLFRHTLSPIYGLHFKQPIKNTNLSALTPRGKAHYDWPNNQTRIFCLILTSDVNHRQMQAVKDTWAKRCDRHLFIYGRDSKTDTDEFVLKTSVHEGRHHLTGKVRSAFEYAYKINNDAFDWILKCDDDTYVIMENLKYLLSFADPKVPGYLGFHMRTGHTMRNGYMSGGAGYVISSSALRNVVNIGFKNGACKKDGGNEDEEMGICLANSSVPVLNSVDIVGRESFHPSNIKDFVSPLDKAEVDWLKSYAWNKTPIFGQGCCSKYSVTYHYVSPSEQYMIEHLLYKTRVYSGAKGDNLGQDNDKNKSIPMFDPKVVEPDD